ncbi:hypothetical protein HOU02_gp048 [Caulobacter phage CcrBL9]|uniref:Uncharacterized protein n=1 Tax=Caulobacter phage CcrBL9 TaxID=2283270 RepID=A0A385EDY8_9CAUD|nr:hypothetical protein HOU02_gp048 [Caulobacter phage CcrBL9]AXQ69072.1 hypothetical protein CcrBL9_gp048c [Caulobacter phage CcrBL9]
MTALHPIFQSTDPYAVIQELATWTDDPAAKHVVFIIRDLLDRGGIGNAIDGCDGEIVVEMLQGWYVALSAEDVTL